MSRFLQSGVHPRFLLLAPFGHAVLVASCPFLGAERTYLRLAPKSDDAISDMEFAAALFLPTQFRMYDALAEDDLLFGIRDETATHRKF